jgi:acyl carrier protein
MDTRPAIRRFIVAAFFVPNGQSISDDDLLLEQGIVDSTGVLEVIRFIEEDFGIKLDDDEIVPENLGSIASIAAFVERKGGVQRSSAAQSRTEPS